MKKIIVLFISLISLFAQAQIPSVGYFMFRADTTTTGGGGGATTLTTNLVAVWEFDETTGTTLYDGTGTYNASFNGTINQTGKLGQSIYTDGVDDFVDVNNIVVAGFPISVSMWVKLPAGGSAFFSSNNGTTYAGINIQIRQSDGRIFIAYGNNTGAETSSRRSFYYTGSLSADTWYNIVITANSNTQADNAVYVNGVNRAFSSTSGTASTVNFTVGETVIGREWGLTPYDLAYIDQTAVWNKILTTDEITTLYNSGNGLPYTSW